MVSFKLYCLDNSELAQYESRSKGYREDIYIYVNGDYYNVCAYDIIRLTQDFESEFEHYGFFSIEPNLILVKEVTLNAIKETIRLLLTDTRYFEKIKTVDISKINLEELKQLL
ncbi:hypothetical protein [Sphingobacterium endophyticum]|uniref:hypothetical protein n=1 Tax=Sphingobacterium endophyticum TaxID=2546448 RepID=UPI0012E311A3|nr:hypothetical protein [Sphingobacterium endophyticum]